MLGNTPPPLPSGADPTAGTPGIALSGDEKEEILTLLGRLRDDLFTHAPDTARPFRDLRRIRTIIRGLDHELESGD